MPAVLEQFLLTLARMQLRKRNSSEARIVFKYSCKLFETGSDGRHKKSKGIDGCHFDGANAMIMCVIGMGRDVFASVIWKTKTIRLYITVTLPVKSMASHIANVTYRQQLTTFCPFFSTICPATTPTTSLKTSSLKKTNR